MSESLRGVSQQFSNNCTEESYKQSESPKHVISGNGNGNGNSQIKHKKYSDYLVNGVPIWQIERRGMAEEEAEAFKQECERLEGNGKKERERKNDRR